MWRVRATGSDRRNGFKRDDLVAQDKPRTARKTEDAETLVRRILADGEWHAQKDVEDARDAAGISYGTLRRAKDSLGVESRKFGSAWKWRMSKCSLSQALRTLAPWHVPARLTQKVNTFILIISIC